MKTSAPSQDPLDEHVRRSETESSLLPAIMQLPFPVALYQGSRHVLQMANPAYQSLISAPLPLGRSAREFIAAANGDLAWFHTLEELDQVYRTGCAIRRDERLRVAVKGGTLESRFFDIALLPRLEDAGLIQGVMVTAAEVTDRVAARQRAESSAALAQSALERERQRVEVVLRAQQVLVEAGTLLASSLDYAVTVNRIAQLAVPGLADCCLIHMFENGELRRMAQAFRDGDDAESQRWVAAFEAMNLAEGPITIALGSGTTVWMQDVTDDKLVAAAGHEPPLAAFRAAAPRSLICVPLTIRGRTVGTMSFVTTTSERRYDKAAVALAEQLGQRAAWAVDSALLYKSVEEARRHSEEARREAENANQLKDSFLAMVSHELRTPMAALLLWENILRSAKDEPMRMRALDAIHQSASAQSKLIEDLLDVSRCISGKLRIDLRPVPVVAIVEAAVEVALPIANAKGIRMDSFLDHSLGEVMGDPDRLQQIVGNLLSNAIKFTDPNGSITVRAERRRSQVEVSVGDTGQGIPADFLPEIFKPFTQGDGSVTRNQGGLGLGLAIVWQLVELHAGAVRAESGGAQRGAKIIVTLPLHRKRASAATAQLDLVSDEEEWVTPAPAREERPTVNGLCVLVVDDEPRVREALTVVLREGGATVTAVPSAAAAIVALRQSPCDVVISDIGMPEEDGFSFMKRLRNLSEEEGATVPAIALTAYARAEDQSRATEVGFDLHLAKPVEADVLIGAIAKLARKGAARATITR